jgi:hypothetical protein
MAGPGPSSEAGRVAKKVCTGLFREAGQGSEKCCLWCRGTQKKGAVRTAPNPLEERTEIDVAACRSLYFSGKTLP